MEKVPTFSKYVLLSIFLHFYSITAQNYADSDGRIIWDQSENAGYNHNVTLIGQDNASQLNLKQAKTQNTPNDIGIGIKEIAITNSSNTNSFFSDKTFLIRDMIMVLLFQQQRSQRISALKPELLLL